MKDRYGPAKKKKICIILLQSCVDEDISMHQNYTPNPGIYRGGALLLLDAGVGCVITQTSLVRVVQRMNCIIRMLLLLAVAWVDY